MKFNNKHILIIVGAIALYAVFLVISDFSSISHEIINFKIQFLPIILILIPCGWFAVFIRWHMLLRNSGIKIPMRDSLKIYLSGFALTVTPGKFGELIKSQLLKSKFDISIKKTAPLVIVERLYDLVGAIAATLFGIQILGIGGTAIGIGAILIFILFMIISSRRIFDRLIRSLSKIKFLSKFLLPLSESYEVVRNSCRGRIVFYSSGLTLADWMLESLGVYFILIAFGIVGVNYFNVLSTYAASLVLGAMSFIPGGLGVAEGSLVGLFSLQGVKISSALALVVIIRACTLWYSVVIGFISLRMSGGLSLKTNTDE